MKTLLVIAAHPDDEALGCGGTIARLTSEGNNVYTLILGEGVTSRDKKRDLAKRENEREKRREVAKQLLQKNLNNKFKDQIVDNDDEDIL